MNWNSASILNGGIYIDSNCSKVTYLTGKGVFIPFSPNGGQAMRDLDAYLTKYGLLSEGEAIPDLYLRESPLEAAIRNHGRLPLWTPERDGGQSPQERRPSHTAPMTTPRCTGPDTDAGTTTETVRKGPQVRRGPLRGGIRRRQRNNTWQNPCVRAVLEIYGEVNA